MALLVNDTTPMNASDNTWQTTANQDILHAFTSINLNSTRYTKTWNGINGNVCRGVIVYFADSGGVAGPGTVTVQLEKDTGGGSWGNATGDTTGSVSATLSVPSSAITQKTFIYFKFTDTHTEETGTGNYRVKLSSTSSVMNCAFRADAIATSNIAKIEVLSATNSLASGNDVIIIGATNGSTSAATVIWDLNVSATTYGIICVANGGSTTQPASPSGNTYYTKHATTANAMLNGQSYLVWVQNGGSLSWDFSAATSFTLDLAPTVENLIQCDTGGTLSIKGNSLSAWRDTTTISNGTLVTGGLKSTVEAGGTQIEVSQTFYDGCAVDDWLSIAATDQRGHTEYAQVSSKDGAGANGGYLITLKSGGGIGTTGSELVTNGGFESVLGAEWVALNSIISAVVSDDAGAYCLKVNNLTPAGGNNGVAYQSIATNIGTTYLLQLRTLSGTTYGRIKLGSTANNTDVFIGDSSANFPSQWLYRQIIFTAISNPTYLALGNVSDLDDRYCYWDSVSVKALANPNTSGGVAYRHKSGAEVCNLTRHSVIKMTGTGSARIVDAGSVTLTGVQCGVVLTESSALTFTNSGFESGSLSGWTVNAGSGGGTFVDDSNAHSGTHAAKGQFVSGSAANLTGPSITVVPGATYKLTFWSAVDVEGGPAGRYLVYDLTNNGNLTTLSSTGQTSTTYGQVTLYFTVPLTPSPCVSIRINLYAPASAGYVYFDDFSLVQVAAPTQGLTTTTSSTGAITTAAGVTGLTLSYCSFIACGGNSAGRGTLNVQQTITQTTPVLSESSIVGCTTTAACAISFYKNDLTNVSIAKFGACGLYSYSSSLSLFLSGIHIYDEGGTSTGTTGKAVDDAGNASNLVFFRNSKFYLSGQLGIYLRGAQNFFEIKDCLLGSDGVNLCPNVTDLQTNGVTGFKGSTHILVNCTLASPTKLTHYVAMNDTMSEFYRGCGIFMQRYGTTANTLGQAGRYRNVVLNGEIADPTTAGVLFAAHSGSACVVITPSSQTAGYTCDWEFRVPVSAGIAPTISFWVITSQTTNGPTLTWAAYDTKDDYTNVGTGTVALTGSWTRVTIHPIAGTDTGVMRIKLSALAGSGGGSIGIDDVAVN